MAAEQLQNIVIIGASIGGGNLVNALAPHLPGTHRILLIDSTDFSAWPVASLRACIVPGWEKRSVAPLETETIFAAGTPHEVIAPNRVIELRRSSVVLEKPFEGSTEIPFFKCVIATGATLPSTIRPHADSTEKEYLDGLTKLQREFKNSTKVLIIGAGPVGLEIAGNVRATYPDKSITIVHSLPHVLNPTASTPDPTSNHFKYSNPPTALKLSVALEKQLKDLNIELITDDRVVFPENTEAISENEWDSSSGLLDGVKEIKLKSGKVVKADFVFNGTGTKPNSKLVEAVDKGAIVDGFVAVNQFLQVISKTPNSPLTTNYYAIGDCCSTPGWKTAQGAQLDAEACATNILAEVKNKPLKVYTRPKPWAMVIPLGYSGGAGTLTVPFFGDIMLPTFMIARAKGQKLFVEDLFYGRFKGSKKLTAPPIPPL